jgi:hypothetical protein
MARHLLKCAERVKHGVCAAIEVHRYNVRRGHRCCGGRAATRLQMRRRNGPRLPKRSWACSGAPAQRKAASKACRSKLPNIKYLAGDKSKLKAIKRGVLITLLRWYDFLPKQSSLVAPRAPFPFRVLARFASHCLAALVERAGGARGRLALTCSLFG